MYALCVNTVTLSQYMHMHSFILCMDCAQANLSLKWHGISLSLAHAIFWWSCHFVLTFSWVWHSKLYPTWGMLPRTKILKNDRHSPHHSRKCGFDHKWSFLPISKINNFGNGPNNPNSKSGKVLWDQGKSCVKLCRTFQALFWHTDIEMSYLLVKSSICLLRCTCWNYFVEQA